MKKGQIFTPHKGLIYGYITPLLTIALFVFLIGVSVFSLMYKSKTNTAAIIDNDLHLFVDIFKRIDTDCRILSFDYTLNRINFLNVKSFSGSEIGSMQLAYPQRWQGPYLQDNPTLQEQDYLIVVTHQGYFITPGSGVRLPNGNTVGLDIVLSKDADIEAMMKPGGLLFYNGKPLAMKLQVGASMFERAMRDDALSLDENPA